MSSSGKNHFIFHFVQQILSDCVFIFSRYSGDGETPGTKPDCKRYIRNVNEEENFIKTKLNWRGIHVYRPLDASSIRHIGGWVGGHFKTFAQIAPLFLAGSGKRQGFLHCLLAACTLFKLVYRRPLQLPFSTYTNLVGEAVDQFLVLAQENCSLAYAKYKIHLLLHLPQHLHLFSSLPDVSTEVEESMNGIFRKLYGASSGRKKTESHFMAKKMAERDNFSHFRTGGYIPDKDTGLLRRIPSHLHELFNFINPVDEQKPSSSPSHPAAREDFVFWRCGTDRCYGRVLAMHPNSRAAVEVYVLTRLAPSTDRQRLDTSRCRLFHDELGNLLLSKRSPALTTIVEQKNLTVIHVYHFPTAALQPR